MTPRLTPAPDWTGPSGDPNDRQFGDVIAPIDLDDADDYDAVLCGEPYDDAVIGRAGAAAAPEAIRESLAAAKTHHFDSGPVESLADVGDVAMPDAPTSAVQESVAEVAGALHGSAAFPVFVGGDNSLTYPNVRPLLDDPDAGRVGVVSFDAHLDCREVAGEPTSGSPYRQLHDDGLHRLAVVGARHFETSTRYADYLDDQGGCIVTAEEVGEDTVAAVDRALDALADVDTIYLSLDVDVLDAAHAPGVSAPTPGGLSSRELFRALRLAASDDRLAGFEVVECAPRLDEGNRTVDAASRAIAHVLASHD